MLNALVEKKVLPYLVGGVVAVVLYFVPEAKPLACASVAAAIPAVWG